LLAISKRCLYLYTIYCILVKLKILFSSKNIDDTCFTFTILSHWSLGGFTLGSFVMIWVFYAPITVLTYEDSKKALRWFHTFMSLIVFFSTDWSSTDRVSHNFNATNSYRVIFPIEYFSRTLWNLFFDSIFYTWKREKCE